MKLLGLSCGREMDNTEVLVKEALMAAEQSGIDVSFMRLADLNIESCRGCSTCIQSLFEGGEGNCVIDDDLSILDEQVMQCDGLILGSPVYTMTPSGLLKMVCERFGPSHDVSFRMEARKISQERGKGNGPDERSFKDRVGAFISVGGGSTWGAMALPLMNLFTFPLNIKVIDQMQLMGVWYGSVLLSEGTEAVERARRLGRNVAEAMAKPINEAEWMGDEPGTCPVCHSNLLTVTNKKPVECPICSIKGEISVTGNGIKVTFSEEEQKKSRLTLEGLLEHWYELKGYAEKARQKVRSGDKEIARKLEKYRGYAEIQIK